MITEFIHDCSDYAKRRGISLVTLGLYAVSDSRLFTRLEAGGQCMPRTMDRVRDYIARNPTSGSDGSVIVDTNSATSAPTLEHPRVPMP